MPVAGASEVGSAPGLGSAVSSGVVSVLVSLGLGSRKLRHGLLRAHELLVANGRKLNTQDNGLDTVGLEGRPSRGELHPGLNRGCPSSAAFGAQVEGGREEQLDELEVPRVPGEPLLGGT